MERISETADHTIHICFLLLAFFVPLILTPFNYELFEYNKMMLTYGITAVIVCSWVSKMIAQKRFFVARTPFDIPIGLFVLSQFVSTLFSMDPIVSWFGYYSRFNGGMLSVICYTLLFYAYVSNVKKEFGKKLLFSLLGSATIVSVYGVLEHFGIDKHIWVQDVQARVFSTLGQPNWLAAYLVTLLPLSLALIFTKKYYVALSILFFVTLLFTRSRSGLAAFLIVDVLFWTLLLLEKLSWKHIRIPLGLSHLGIIICLLVFGTGIQKIDTFIKGNQPAPQVVQEPTGPVLESGGTESGVIRKYVWQGALNAWKATPKTMVIGTGTETFAFAFYQYKPVGHNLTSEWDFLYNKAHNEYLNFLATTGIFGLGSYLLFIGSIIYWSIRSLRKQPDALTTGLFAGWLSLLVTNFFGFSVVVTQLLFFLLPAAYYVLKATPKLREHAMKNVALYVNLRLLIFKSSLRAILLLSTIGCGLFFIMVLLLTWFADKTFATGYRSSRAGQYVNAYAPLRESVRLNSAIPLYHDEYAVVLSSLALGAFESKDATLAGTLAVYALTENDRAIRISPHNVNFWKSRTKIFYALSSIDGSYLPQAINSLIEAQTLSPSDPKISYNLAILYGKLGDTQKAVEYLLEAKQLKPNYRDAYYALYIFYTETKQPDKAKEILTEYITTVDSTDNEFRKLLE
jgi:O-antigen ligase